MCMRPLARASLSSIISGEVVDGSVFGISNTAVTPPSAAAARSGFEIFLPFEARLAEVDLAVDHARQDVEAVRREDFAAPGWRRTSRSRRCCRRLTPMSVTPMPPGVATVPPLMIEIECREAFGTSSRKLWGCLDPPRGIAKRWRRLCWNALNQKGGPVRAALLRHLTAPLLGVCITDTCSAGGDAMACPAGIDQVSRSSWYMSPMRDHRLS